MGDIEIVLSPSPLPSPFPQTVLRVFRTLYLPREPSFSFFAALDFVSTSRAASSRPSPRQQKILATERAPRWLLRDGGRHESTRVGYRFGPRSLSTTQPAITNAMKPVRLNISILPLQFCFPFRMLHVSLRRETVSLECRR